MEDIKKILKSPQLALSTDSIFGFIWLVTRSVCRKIQVKNPHIQNSSERDHDKLKGSAERLKWINSR